LIFTIRSGQYLGKEVIDFVNYIHNDLTRHQILIIFSINDPRKIEGLIHAIKIKIEALNLNQTREYVHKLLKIIPPEDFSFKLWSRSNGNPLFIEQILIDLTQNNKIWKSNQFRFDFDLDSYRIPEEILHLIYLRMAHLSESSYRNLQKLAFVNTPLSKNLIKHILKISEKEVFFLIKDGTDNEILAKRDGYYYFTFKEAVERFQQESTQASKAKVSQRLLQYFDKQTISQIPIVKGVIKHATEIEDLPELKKFKLILVKLYFDRGERDKAFDEMVEVVELNFTGKMPISPVELRQDLISLIDMSEWATSTKIPVRLKKNVIAMPEISEKHLLIAIFYMSLEKYSLAQCRLERALSLAITGKQRIYILLKLAEIYTAIGNTDRLGKTIKELEQYQLSNELKISFISLKGLYLGITGSLQEGIQLIEDYIPAIETQNNDNFFIKLGTIHNTLAYLYHQRKVLDEADRNFQIARKNWEKVNYQRKLSTVYNNIGDVALVQGYTWEALEYFKKALVICKTIDCKKNYVLSLLNHGETYIKLGEFKKAEEYLLAAQKRSVNFENKPFLSSIIYNLAIAKSKLYNFGYYYNFISENAPEILVGKIDQITPMTKNYFYYLYNIGDYQKIDQLLGKIKQLCLNCNQQEFYYQILGFITLKKKDFSNALKHLELAFKYSQENRSIYAQAINYIRLAEFYLEIGDTNKALEILLQSKMISEQNSYNYWIRVIDLRMIRAQLREGSVSLRLLIRQLLEIRDYVQENNLFHLEIECYEMLIQIYSFLKIKQQAVMYHTLYRERIKDAVLDIPQHDRSLYFKKTSYGTSDFTSFKTLEINVKKYRELENWEEELYDILKLKDNSRIRFFLDRTIKNLLSPDFYAILLVDDITGKKEPFLYNNTEYHRLYSSKYQERVLNSIEDNKIIARKMDGSNILFVPLRIKGAKVGCLVLADKGELKFQDNELKVISNLKLHLSSILIRIKEFSDLNDEMKLMTKLVEMNQKFFSVLNLDKIEQDLVAFALDFIGGSRGFLIKKDKYQNYVYKIALDDSKHLIKNFSNVSKTLLSEVQKTGEPIYIENIKDNQSLNVYQNLRGETFSAYCAPIIINKEIYGFLYIDNYNSTENRITINSEFIRLLLIQIGVAITNALHYELLMKKNHEISSLEQLKNNFINIVSHELKTPLVTLQGYINRMLKFKIPKRDLKIVQQVEKSVDRLYLVTNDIINHNKFIMLKKIDKSLVSIQDIMEIVADEIKTISKERHMQIKLEIESDLPLISVNWEAVQLMLNNIVLNAVRFTRDFGTIIIGARRSAFQQEEVNQQESLLIYVQDNGIGIPEEEQTKIFQKFYEINKIYSHSSGIVEFKSSGLGLGLATVKLIVDLHDGKIWIHSKEKEGTTVFIALPVVKHEEKED
ncbi:MAG: hypothetical protein JW996_02735, partial [Candidatus Cloacimonetes bacterium]|nr:hypothetical protein [Candidatus Cloacimonadota bacterium]